MKMYTCSDRGAKLSFADCVSQAAITARMQVSAKITKFVAYSGLLNVTVSPSAVESAHVLSTTGTSGAATATRAFQGAFRLTYCRSNHMRAYHL